MNKKSKNEFFNSVYFIWILALICACLSVRVSAQQTLEQKLAAWLIGVKARAERVLVDLKGEDTEAQAVLEQAQRAETKAIQLQDEKALSIAQEAVALALKVKEEKSQQYIQLIPVVEGFRTIPLDSFPPKNVEAVAFSIKDLVLIKRSTYWAPLNGPLKPGDIVMTPPGSFAYICFKDSTYIFLNPNSTFTLRKNTKADDFYEFLEGRFHIYTPSWFPGKRIRYLTPCGSLPVRGTEFSVRIDQNGLTYLSAYSGIVELIPDVKKIDRTKLTRWWEKKITTLPPEPIGQSKLLRITYLEGEVNVESPDGESRTAIVGDPLMKGDKLITGENGFVQSELAMGHRAVLNSNSQLEVGQDSSSKPYYRMLQGHFYFDGRLVKNTGVPEPKFITHNTVIETQNAEFEVVVSESGLSDFMALAGKLVITAQIEKLDLDKVEPWWRE